MGSALQTYKKNEKLAVWAQKVQECRASGQSVAEWCEENGISQYTYYEWQKKVFAAAEEAHKVSQPEFVEVVRGMSGQAVASINKNGLVVEIYNKEARISLL